MLFSICARLLSESADQFMPGINQTFMTLDKQISLMIFFERREETKKEIKP